MYIHEHHIQYLRQILLQIALDVGLPPVEPWHDGRSGNHKAVLSWGVPDGARNICAEINIGIGQEAVCAYVTSPLVMLYRAPLKRGKIPKGETLEELCRGACTVCKEELEYTQGQQKSAGIGFAEGT